MRDFERFYGMDPTKIRQEFDGIIATSYDFDDKLGWEPLVHDVARAVSGARRLANTRIVSRLVGDVSGEKRSRLAGIFGARGKESAGTLLVPDSYRDAADQLAVLADYNYEFMQNTYGQGVRFGFTQRRASLDPAVASIGLTMVAPGVSSGDARVNLFVGNQGGYEQLAPERQLALSALGRIMVGATEAVARGNDNIV